MNDKLYSLKYALDAFEKGLAVYDISGTRRLSRSNFLSLGDLPNANVEIFYDKTMFGREENEIY